MITLTLTFNVSGSIKQTVHILSGDSPDQFFAKIQSGEYLTSISSTEILEKKNFTVVGRIENQETLDNTEFLEFEVHPHGSTSG